METEFFMSACGNPHTLSKVLPYTTKIPKHYVKRRILRKRESVCERLLQRGTERESVCVSYVVLHRSVGLCVSAHVAIRSSSNYVLHQSCAQEKDIPRLREKE